MGRRLTLTPELQESFVLLLEAGNFVETACEALRVSRRSFYEWMARGERDDEIDEATIFAEFRDAVLQAKAKAEITALAVIQAAAKSDNWQAAAWYLERTRPKRFARQTVVEEKTKGRPSSVADIAARRKEKAP